MNGRVRYLGLGGVVLALVMTVVAFQASTSAPALAQEEEEDKSQLMQAMERMQDGMRQLRRQARRERYDDSSVEIVQDMTVAAVAAMRETPPYASEVPTEEREQFHIDYQKMNAKLVKELLDLQIALLEERNEDIMAHLKELINLENEGHDKFDPMP